MAARAAAGAVTAYCLFLSPLLPPACRFYPTCSAYALTAYRTLGFWRGSWLTARRLLRCHPLHPGGYDPVPAPGSRNGPPPSGRR
ncbi:MAG: membrane protein insertion efficiency factor YidD [Thermodesulfobacteriota bacterium]